MAGETFGYYLYTDPGTSALSLPIQSDDRVLVGRNNGSGPSGHYLFLTDLITGIGPIVDAEPLSGATLTASAGQGGYNLVPAGTLATLTVVLPPTPSDGQVFELSTTQQLTALTVSAPGGATVRGASYTLNADSGSSWRYREAYTAWMVRY